MEPTPAFKRRVKRHIIGPQHRFFAVASPGFEAHLREEIAAMGAAVLAPEAAEGGTLFDGRLPLCHQANLNLRLATRVWMRVAEFTAANFRRLQHKVAQIPWELYLYSDTRPEVAVRSIHSRLYHSEAVSQRITGEIEKRISAYGFSSGKSAAQKLLARIRDDRVTLSLDTSGDALYKRGLKSHRGSAPLRETHAALALALLGYDGSAPLIDPMTGTGTFSLEAAMIAQNIPAGWFRAFQFMEWPGFSEGQWAYLKREAEKTIGKGEGTPIFASDVNPAVCTELRNCITRHHLDNVVRVQQQDFFRMAPQKLTSEKGYVVLNPPYGKRLGSKNRTGEFYGEVAKKLASDFRGWRLAMILPEKRLLSRVPFRLHIKKLHHGGLTVCMGYGTIP